MTELDGRRPLKVRNLGFSQRLARRLSRTRLTANHISIASVVFALLAAACLLGTRRVDGTMGWVLPLLAAGFIQCRLLCNLLDGMVAVEGGKSTPSGELFNDIPDRLADPIVLIAAGYSTSVVPWAATVGWLAALVAVVTAYLRTLAASIGAPVDFRGPMAKQQRMAMMTLACVLTAPEPLLWRRGWFLFAALVLIVVGGVVTMIRRARAAYVALESATDA